ncbi:MAG: hypothetical protein R3B12_01095 [Candidatus Saccharimonadales bacterium]
MSNTGGSGVPNQAVFNVVKDWSASGSITMISQNGASCWSNIRMVNDSGTPTTTYIDVQATGVCGGANVSVITEENAFGGFYG